MCLFFFSFASSRHSSSSKIVFHTFLSIMVFMPYLHFHFFWRDRHWTFTYPTHAFFISSFRASLKQEAAYHLSSHCCTYIKLLFCLFAPETSSKLSGLDSLCKNPYLTFNSSQTQACEHRETGRSMLFLLFLFLQKRDLILSVSHTVWSPVTVQSVQPVQKSDKNTGWLMTCHTLQAWFFTGKLFSSLAQLFVQGFQASYLNSDKEIAIQC